MNKVILNAIPHPSPNFDDRPSSNLSAGDLDSGGVIDTVVIHYTDMESTALSLERLCNPTYKVSAHYLIADNGDLYQLVATEKRAWHAGDSYWNGRSHVNNFSIGIEIQNPGYNYFAKYNTWKPYSASQYATLLTLLRQLCQDYPLIINNIVGHNDITGHRSIPKIDPGPHFDWQLLALNGFKRGSANIIS